MESSDMTIYIRNLLDPLSTATCNSRPFTPTYVHALNMPNMVLKSQALRLAESLVCGGGLSPWLAHPFLGQEWPTSIPQHCLHHTRTQQACWIAHFWFYKEVLRGCGEVLRGCGEV
eukprot:1143932-Pelagomonas_calceolata.AAC.2